MIRSVYVAIPLLALLTVLQATVLPHLVLFGILPQLAVLVVLVWAQLRGAYEGLLWAFIAGFLLDLFSSGPMGATALTLMLAVLLIIRLKSILPEHPFLMPLLLSGVGFAAYWILYVTLARVAGYGFSWHALGVLPQLTLFHGAVGLLVYWLLYPLDRALYPRQIEA
jgi:rod shape-determining protein MreD